MEYRHISGSRSCRSSNRFEHSEDRWPNQLSIINYQSGKIAVSLFIILFIISIQRLKPMNSHPITDMIKTAGIVRLMDLDMDLTADFIRHNTSVVDDENRLYLPGVMAREIAHLTQPKLRGTGWCRTGLGWRWWSVIDDDRSAITIRSHHCRPAASRVVLFRRGPLESAI